MQLKNQKHLISKFTFFRKKLICNYKPEEAEKLVYILFEDLLGIKRNEIFIRDEELTAEQIRIINEATDLLLKNMPIQYITHNAFFYDRSYYVDEHVLIPRQETEELVKIICDEYMNKSPRILDIGTGCGCIAISLKANIPASEVTAVDIHTSVLKVAEKNAGQMAIKFQKLNILSEKSWKAIAGQYHIIVSNPPYIPESEKVSMDKNVIEYEPHSALFVPDNDSLLFYRKIADFGLDRLISNGQLFFEIHEKKSKEIRELLEDYKYENVIIYKDINGNDRMVSAKRL